MKCLLKLLLKRYSTESTDNMKAKVMNHDIRLKVKKVRAD